MIKHLIFDFGDVFLELDKKATTEQLKQFGLNEFTPEMLAQNQAYEKGLISTADFVTFYKSKVPKLDNSSFIKAWNSILGLLPKQRLEFIQSLAKQKKYQLILLSNTNDLHIEWVKKNITDFETFKACFDAFYLSYKINLRKPTPAIFQFVLDQHHLKPNDCLFVDDTLEHTLGAASLGIHTWHLHVGKEDVTQLFTKKEHLF